MALITFAAVERAYQIGDQHIKALDGVSFDLEPGTFNVILGQSGAGKTTLLNLLGGMDSPTKGRITVAGEEISRLSEAALTTYRREKIGFVFQFYNLVPNLTVLENVQLAEEICPDPLDAREVLAGVGLGHRLDNFPSQISGGEQQRVAIARALAKNPQLLLCDEPTGALDSATGKLVLKLIRDMAARLDKTVVIVTHHAPIAEMGQTVIHLRDGRVFEMRTNQTPKDIEAIAW